MLQELEQILDLKAQGWSDALIKRELDLDATEYKRRLKKLDEEDHFKHKALRACIESTHRLMWLRRQVLNEYADLQEKAKRESSNPKFKKNYKAIGMCVKRMMEIDVAIPRICEQLRWRPEDLQRALDQGKYSGNLSEADEHEMYDEYRRITGSDA